MCKALIIGAGGVGTVVAQKIAANPIFSDVMLASRTKAKCDAIAAAIGGDRVKTAQVDADNVADLCELFRAFKPDIVVNVALPYQDLTIMDACLECGVNYLDTANYEPKDEAHFEYSWQWAYQERFKEKGLTAILGCGFDPGVTAIFTAYAAKHHFDEIHYLDIVDCNAGNHGMAFATNFNPEINIREITQNGRYYEEGKWVTTKPLEYHKDLTYPNIGPRDSYLLYHEELESLVKNFPTIKRARFWMTFGQEYLTHLRVIQNIGMARIDEIDYNGVKIVPLQFLKAVLPNPQDLGENYEGETSIGCRIRGVKDGKERTYYVYNNCSHQEAYKETGMQGVSYTTGVPAMIGAMMFLQGLWKRPGVWNVEEFDPDPFMEQLNKQLEPLKKKAETVMVSLDTVLMALQEIFSEDANGNIRGSLKSVSRTLDNVEHASGTLNDLLANESSRISKILENINSITGNLENSNANITRSLDNITGISDSLKAVNLANTVRYLNSVLAQTDSIVMKINRGKGTLGGVVNDRDLYYNLTAVSENLNKLLTEFRQNPKRFVNLSLFDFSSGKSTQDTYGIVIAESEEPLALDSELYRKYPDLREMRKNGKYLYLIQTYKNLKQAEKDLKDVNKIFKQSFIVKIQ